MKNLIIGFGTIMISVLTIMIIAALNINTINKLDLESATRLAVYQTLQQRYDTNTIPVIRVKNADGKYKSPSDKASTEYTDGKYVYKDFDLEKENPEERDTALIELFNENLSMLLKKQNHVTVKILGCSYDYGLLSVNVSYTYDNMGIERTIDTTQTVIRETGSMPTGIQDTSDDYVYAVLYTDGELAISKKSIEKDLNKTEQVNYGKINLTNEDFPAWTNDASSIKSVRIATKIVPISCYGWFKDCKNLTEIKNIENLDTSECENMNGMFIQCQSLSSIDLSHFNTSNVTTMKQMFNNCKSLTNLDLSTFNTKNVKDTSWMFAFCSGLTTLDISMFNTKHVTDMTAMFYGAKNITEYKGLENFNTSNVTSMRGMFSCGKNYTGDGKVKNLDGIENWDTSNVIDMTDMFMGQSQITNYKISKWNTSNCTSFNFMFGDNFKLTSIDLSKWNTKNVKTIRGMFHDCQSLPTIGDVSKWNTKNMIDISSWLSNCQSFIANDGLLDLSNWNTEKVIGMNNMFNGCSKLTKINIVGFDTSAVSDKAWEGTEDTDGIFYKHGNGMQSMFANCPKLKEIIVGSKWNTIGKTTTDMFTNCGVPNVTKK